MFARWTLPELSDIFVKEIGKQKDHVFLVVFPRIKFNQKFLMLL